MKKNKIIAVSAGQYDYKKGTDLIKGRIRYLNYGLLGLATILHDKLGLNVLVAQGNQKSPSELFERIEKEGVDISEECECFLLSIPSYYSVTWCAEFCRIIKEKYGKICWIDPILHKALR